MNELLSKPTLADVEAVDNDIFHKELRLLLNKISELFNLEEDKIQRKILMRRSVKVRRKLGWNISADLFEKDLNNGEY